MMFSEDIGSAHEVILPVAWQPLDKWLLLHPKYRQVFHQAIDQLFYGRGPMVAPERHFVALMAASRHRCHFLINLHKHEFERLGGNKEWLKGLAFVPPKIQSLDVLNTVLAHQPWTAIVNHLTALTKCSSPDNWSLSELVQAVIVLAQTHVLCSFVLGNGAIEPNEVGREPVKLRNHQQEKENGREGEVEMLLKRMNELRESQSQGDGQQTEHQKQRHFLEIHCDQTSLDSSDNSGAEASLLSTVASKTTPVKEDDSSSLFTYDQRFCYIDFAQRARTARARTHKIHDLSWEDHGYSCVDELYNEMADILDKKFTLTQNLTYFTMGGYSDVDTTKYRNAIWMYIQSLYGIRHDDYNYGEVNVMLSREMKTFIKTICCFPDTTTPVLRKSVMIDFKPSEKVHVLLMIMEARLQAELIYFFRALIRFNNQSSSLA